MEARLGPWWQNIKKHPIITTGIIVVLSALIAFTFAVHTFGWDWTGITGEQDKVTITSNNGTTTTTTEKPRWKTLWDVLDLLIIPLVLAAGGYGC